ncbi:protein FAM204A [Electrophorus electricus]|uniref:Family with sequence similarity 204 member A n=1 Tax=Electrophorus electricus TaxID=8005 RepID=A0A4W4H7Q8_ELEEL|nr:protein FAM204A [Electrophorus electricus]
MYSGLLPKGICEAELSTDEDDDGVPNTQSKTDGQSDSPTKLNHYLSLSQSVLSSASQKKTDCDGCCTVANVQNDPSLKDCLPGVRLDLWQKFKVIQKEKEVQKTKQPQPKKRRKKHHQKGGAEEQDDSEKREKARMKHWEELTEYFGINDRFQPPACGRLPLKSSLEKSMESAIAEGDYGKAEELSDRLASRELAVKITEAAGCRDFARTKQEEASHAAQKRRGLVAWGFEAKKRWETKSNMGYM